MLVTALLTATLSATYDMVGMSRQTFPLSSDTCDDDLIDFADNLDNMMGKDEDYYNLYCGVYHNNNVDGGVNSSILLGNIGKGDAWIMASSSFVKNCAAMPGKLDIDPGLQPNVPATKKWLEIFTSCLTSCSYRSTVATPKLSNTVPYAQLPHIFTPFNTEVPAVDFDKNPAVTAFYSVSPVLMLMASVDSSAVEDELDSSSPNLSILRNLALLCVAMEVDGGSAFYAATFPATVFDASSSTYLMAYDQSDFWSLVAGCTTSECPVMYCGETSITSPPSLTIYVVTGSEAGEPITCSNPFQAALIEGSNATSGDAVTAQTALALYTKYPMTGQTTMAPIIGPLELFHASVCPHAYMTSDADFEGYVEAPAIVACLDLYYAEESYVIMKDTFHFGMKRMYMPSELEVAFYKYLTSMAGYGSWNAEFEYAYLVKTRYKMARAYASAHKTQVAAEGTSAVAAKCGYFPDAPTIRDAELMCNALEEVVATAVECATGKGKVGCVEEAEKVLAAVTALCDGGVCAPELLEPGSAACDMMSIYDPAFTCDAFSMLEVATSFGDPCSDYMAEETPECYMAGDIYSEDYYYQDYMYDYQDFSVWYGGGYYGGGYGFGVSTWYSDYGNDDWFGRRLSEGYYLGGGGKEGENAYWEYIFASDFDYEWGFSYVYDNMCTDPDPKSVCNYVMISIKPLGSDTELFLLSAYVEASACTDAGSTSTCSNGCSYDSDGDCDDGGPGAEFSLCVEGSDCADCGVRSAPCTMAAVFTKDVYEAIADADDKVSLISEAAKAIASDGSLLGVIAEWMTATSKTWISSGNGKAPVDPECDTDFENALLHDTVEIKGGVPILAGNEFGRKKKTSHIKNVDELFA